MADTQKKDKMSEGMKAEINKQRHEQGQKGIGEYGEAAGGGTPAKPGQRGRGSMGGDFEVVNSKKEADEIRKDDPDAIIRYNQPRDENGQFTYNSANGKGLSTKNSRGHTKPPFLAGVDLTFIKKGSTFKYTNENGDMVRIISSIDMTANELVAACTVYFETEGGFLGVIGTAVTKKGSPSKVEKTGEIGKTGETDLTAKAQSTQDAIEAAAKMKDQNALNEAITRMGLKKKVPVGPNMRPEKPLKEKEKFNDDEEFEEKVINNIKNNPEYAKSFVRKHKETFDKIQEKNPKATPSRVIQLIVTGKIKKFSDLL